ncbi:MAG: proline dehydrogenase family protein [Acidobacteriota bacterium]|nr:MAG: proline dehydrogenase family protein [Acidobacteriota bacterium]
MSPGRRALLRLLMLAPQSLVWRFARVYIAGQTLDEAVDAIRALNGEGCRATLDVLGESVTRAEEVQAYVDEYVRALEAIVEARLDANISIKPTAMGLAFSPELARDSVRKILEAAAGHGLTVRLDMEDSSVTQKTLDLYRALRAEGLANVGVVLQSYLRRTLVDARELAAAGASVRVCKGIYVEPRRLAYQDYWLVRDAFLDAVEVLLREPKAYVAIATHDEWLVFQSRRLIAELRVPRERYEFQMLLGVDPAMRKMIVSEGHPLRVYVPYGTGWYAYSIRRLVENPRFAAHVVRNVLGFGPPQRA